MDEPLAKRREAFKALLEEYGVTEHEYDEGEEEDPRPYVSGEEPCAQFVCITENYSSRNGSHPYFLPTFDSLRDAQDRAVEYDDDDMFEELPVEVRDLDTGDSWKVERRYAWRKESSQKKRQPVVVVVRDPDASNEYTTFGEVKTYDIDCGYADLRDEEEYREWSESHEAEAKEWEKDGYPEVAELIRGVVNSYGPDAR